MGQMSKISSNNTKVITQDDGTVVVRLHRTDVVTLFTDGTVVLNTGGWDTVTTRARMNQAANQLGLHYRVFREKYQLFVRVNRQTLPFESSITFTPTEPLSWEDAQ
jgi:hypothetical protein